MKEITFKLEKKMKNKVTIIGAGMVGSTVAYSLVLQDIVDEIALIDLNEDLVKAQVMDLEHSVPFIGNTEVKVGSYEDCVDSEVVVITCGSAQKEGETRLDLVQKNAKIIKSIVPEIFQKNPEAVLVMVTNPVDVLTNLAISMFPEKKRQIMGTGTILDSARLRHLIGAELKVSPQSVHAYILGEHGDSEFAAWSNATIGGAKIGNFPQLDEKKQEELFLAARSAAYAIINGKQSTYYAIGAGCAHLVKAIIHDKKTVLPISHLFELAQEKGSVCLSFPAVVGRGGVLEEVPLILNEQEKSNLLASAEILEQVFNSIK